MRARIRYITPFAVAVALTAACGESGSSGTGGGGAGGETAASGDACAPVPGDQLVVLEDDRNLQNADNIIPAVNAAAAQANPALLPALDEVSAALTTDELVAMNAAVDVQRQSAEEVAAAWVEENIDTAGLEQGSGTVVVGGANFTESTILATIYADVLDAAGFDASVQEVGNRELYLPALQSGEIQVFPEYLSTATEFLEGDDANQVASGDVDATVEALTPLAEEAGLVFGQPSEAADQNAFAVTQAFADELGVSTLSELAEACGDGSLVLGGPGECPERPFCQPGLEETYGLEFDSFRELDAGGPLTKAALEQGEISLGLVFSSDGALAQG
ncbi:glycine betaine ABC transporter substrate-binding protein [Blastococcus saxobsidens]|uniref:Glycine betaine/choline-binding (Lipo)protein of an ABC-type transport system (Osmoprotectant binding protein) n=1 Tax=Blastococcus saxobsidens (strain DD2) TaxID=1146883 RepID=H6RPX2_BLASD|nr:glycine betaine ABC transporter substrate-binding protein [Blastococcus saxobsidens]CCG01541.1 Glycine betaine/choline-binding (Lipo)protein of an ABC-type transport system (Osmoprotectant binding protein) [Blastococcus saxobsidens DD2]